MAKIKIKLRLSTVPGKAGTVYYQVSHKKEVRQLTTNIRLLPEEWDFSEGRICKSALAGSFRFSALQRRIDRETEQLHQIIRNLELSGSDRTLSVLASCCIRSCIRPSAGTTPCR